VRRVSAARFGAVFGRVYGGSVWNFVAKWFAGGWSSGVRAEIRIWACAADVLYEAVELVTGGELVFFASSDASACAVRLGVGLVVSLCGES